MGDGGGILVVGPSWVGDMVMAQTLFKSLKAQYPAAPIDVIAPPWSQPLLARMPEVREALDLPIGHGEVKLALRRRLGKQLRVRDYRRAVVLPNSLKSALIPFFADIETRTGWRGEMRYGLLNDVRVLDKSLYPLMIQRFAALAYPPGAALPDPLPWPRLIADTANQHAALTAFSLDRQRPILALCPGAEFGPSKRWPEQYYAAVAAEMIRRGWQVWLFGSANDRAVTQAIAAALPPDAAAHCRDLAGATQLAQAIDLLALADAVVSNDSGLMHIAAALARPLVVVYGSTSPGFTPPLAEHAAVLSIPVDCGPCFKRECPLGHMKCMHGVTPGRVIDAVSALAGAQVS